MTIFKRPQYSSSSVSNFILDGCDTLELHDTRNTTLGNANKKRYKGKTGKDEE